MKFFNSNDILNIDKLHIKFPKTFVNKQDNNKIYAFDLLALYMWAISYNVGMFSFPDVDNKTLYDYLYEGS